MQSHEPLRALGGSHHFRDRDRGRVGRKDRIFLHDRVQGRVHLFLLIEILDDGLDDDVAIGEIPFVGGPFQAGPNGLGSFFDRTFLGKFGERFFDPGESFVEKLLFDFEHGDMKPGGCRDLCDAGAHEAAA